MSPNDDWLKRRQRATKCRIHGLHTTRSSSAALERIEQTLEIAELAQTSFDDLLFTPAFASG